MKNEITAKTTKNGWGGKRAGSGRKPGPYAGAAKVTTVVLTAPLIAKLHKLGGSSWIREQIIKSPDKCAVIPNPESLASLTSVGNYFKSDERDPISSCLIKNPEETVFCIADDDEIKEKGIEAGDLLIVDRTQKPKQGDLVVVHTANGYSIRCFVNDGETPKERSNLYIQPSGDWRVLGIIVFVVKQLSAEGAEPFLAKKRKQYMSNEPTMNEADPEETVLVPPSRPVPIIRWPSGKREEDHVAEEVPISLVYNGISHVVMMASPDMLEEFAIGFSLSEKIIPDISHIYDISVHEGCACGYIVDLEISPRCFFKLKDHRRSMVGRTGCGICGVESLEAVNLPVEKLAHSAYFRMSRYSSAMEKFREVQKIGAKTGSTHAMMAFDYEGNFLGGAEDVGRHVAMDKLLGLRAKLGWKECVIFMSSRASYEMVQKAAVCGVEILFAVSAPTNRALSLAKECGLTLCAFCREGRANIYCGEERLLDL